MTAEVCIKRDLSRWPTCHCPPCMVQRRRMAKLRRTGRLPRPDPALAWERIDSWMGAGYSAAWIATACGLQMRNIESALSERNAGHVRKLGATVTGRIMAADIRTGTAGHCDALVARRRLQALACHGFDTSRLQAASGISFVTLASIRRGATKDITAARHHQIADLYELLSGRFGTSTEARRRATLAGWVPPLGWDNIDDPTETPNTGATSGWTSSQRFDLDDVEFLLDVAPYTLDQLAERLNVTKSAIEHACERGDRRDILTRLARNTTLRDRAQAA